MLDFVHLHVHSCYSFHEGTDSPADLAARAARFGCRALALTDEEAQTSLVNFLQRADYTGYGLVSAVTATARETESDDRRGELELIGGSMLLDTDTKATQIISALAA